jgi:glycerophosphoryl diester phosphodiesterase
MTTRFIFILLLISCAVFGQKKSTTKVIAHRGAWKNTGFPQNSIASLQAAIDIGCFASECDIWMTSDSVLVVNHDPHFYGMAIEEKTYAELLTQKHPNGELIPKLEDYIKTFRTQKKTRLVLDIKPSKVSKERSLVLARKCFEMVQQMKIKNMTDYIFFDYDACLLLRKLDPRANVAYLNGDRSPEEVANDKLWGIDYSFKVFQKNENWIKDAQEKKLTTNVWTVNEKELMESFIQQKVDFITTDEPELLIKILSNAK